eukprot:1160701-Pelagomonas_calceolata.AAC.7
MLLIFPTTTLLQLKVIVVSYYHTDITTIDINKTSEGSAASDAGKFATPDLHYLNASVEPVPSGALLWAWGGRAGPRHVSFFLAIFVPHNIARCTAEPPKLKSPNNRLCLACMPSLRAKSALGGPCWPSSAQLPNKEVSEHFAHGLSQLTDTAVPPETSCLA